MVKIKKTLYDNGGSIALGIPKDVAEAMGLKAGMEVYVDVEEGKYGQFGAFWPVEKDRDSDGRTRKSS